MQGLAVTRRARVSSCCDEIRSVADAGEGFRHSKPSNSSGGTSQRGSLLLKGGRSLSWAKTRATATESGPPREQPLAHW